MIAVAERSQWVIEHYPQTPQIPEALATLAYSYDKLGDKATSQQYIEVLKLNYPSLVKKTAQLTCVLLVKKVTGSTVQL